MGKGALICDNRFCQETDLARFWGTFSMRKPTGLYPNVHADATAERVVSNAGAALLVETLRKVGLDRALSEALAPWMRPLAVHDPGKIVLDLALSLVIGGDCLADIDQLRAEPAIFGRVASDPTVSRLVDALAADSRNALAAIASARAAARAAAWRRAGTDAPDHGIDKDNPLVIDLDATLVAAHSEKQDAAPTYKRGFGFHPLCAFIDHGAEGTGEAGAAVLRPGNAGSNTAADHIAVTKLALAQLPFHRRGGRIGRKVLIRTDGAGASHEFMNWVAGQGLSYSIGFGLTPELAGAAGALPEAAWTPAYDADGVQREGAKVAELTRVVNLSAWPAGMRLIVRAEKPHPGAQLRFTDSNGWRLTAFATNTEAGQLAQLELRHRRRARCEDRIRNAKDTGLTNLPLHDFAQNEIWLAIVQLACDLTAWTQMLALTAHLARRWEPKRFRLRLLSVPGTIARGARRTRLRLSARAPHVAVITAGLARLKTIRLNT